MNELFKSIIESWQIHNRSMLYLIENLSDDALACSLSKRGGRNVAAQLSHCLDVRFFRMEAYLKEHNISLVPFEKEHIPKKAELLSAYEKTGEVMEQIILQSLEHGGKAPSFARGIVPMIGYYISHEAHHRGHALLTIKSSGIPLPDSLKWGVWEWNKL